MMIALSLPVWVAASVCLFVGFGSLLVPEIKGWAAYVGLALLPVSSALGYVAARMCGLV